MCSRDNYYVNSLRKIFSASAYRSCHPMPKEAEGTAHKECFIFRGSQHLLSMRERQDKELLLLFRQGMKHDSLLCPKQSHVCCFITVLSIEASLSLDP